MASNIEIFLCYAHEDERLCKELVTHLGALKRQGFFDVWYDREITAGTEYEQETDKHLNTAQIILLLVSPNFMASDYCYCIEMQRAIERHERGEAIVIPVILRPVFFERAAFAKLTPLPTNKKPITHSSWYSLDEALFDVAEGIRKAVEKLTTTLSINSPVVPVQSHSSQTVPSLQRTLPLNIPMVKTGWRAKNQQYQPGDRVRHDKFGEGIILKSVIEDDTEFVDVQFQGKHGRKRLSMDFAKLEKL